MKTTLSFLSSMFLISLAACALSAPAAATVIGTNVIAQPVTPQRIATLPAAQQKAWRQYLARSEKQKALDKATLQAEMKSANVTESKLAPQGRNAYGMYLSTSQSADYYASAYAIRIATNVVSFQIADGGWSKNIDMTSNPRVPGGRYDTDNLNRYPDPTDFDKPVDDTWHYLATLDNDATTTQIIFLAHVTTALLAANRAADAQPFRASVARGVQYLLASQYPNGGWPQVWPLEGGYHDAITINDDAMLHAIEVLHSAADPAGDYNYLPPALRRRAAAAADHGMKCLLSLQIQENGARTAWAQQYDALTLAPTSARNYEMASIASGESSTIVQYLMSLPQPTPAEVAAVHAAAAWFTKTEIFGFRYGSGDFRADRANSDGRKLVAVAAAGPIWSRYYQIGTDKPIFGDRDKTIHDDVNEISRERRNGYSWYNADGIALLATYKTWAATHPQA
ncbi:MAG: pectate lyase [Candidatus Acidiferrales bacterium]